MNFIFLESSGNEKWLEEAEGNFKFDEMDSCSNSSSVGNNETKVKQLHSGEAGAVCFSCP